MTSTTQAGRTLSYQYDAASNRTALVYPETGANALTADYLYDVLNRVTQIEENGATSGPGLLAQYGYDTLGRRSSIARAGGSGLATGYTYDNAGRLSQLSQTGASALSVTFTYGYNAANQIISRTDTNGAFTVRPASETAGYSVNGLNQYTSVTGVSQTYNGANSSALSYDALGRLQTETISGSTTTFVYDGDFLLGEYGPSGAILNRYVPGPGLDEPATWYQGSGTSTRTWYSADNLGSVLATADQSGNSTGTYAYGPYGEPLTSAGAPAWGGSRYRYTGQVELPGADVYFYKARVYDPAMGRFYQTDPADSDANSDANLYAYAAQDPVNNWDPSGMVKLASGRSTVQYTGGPEVDPLTVIGELLKRLEGQSLEDNDQWSQADISNIFSSYNSQTLTNPNPGAARNISGRGKSAKPQNTKTCAPVGRFAQVGSKTNLPNGYYYGSASLGVFAGLGGQVSFITGIHVSGGAVVGSYNGFSFLAGVGVAGAAGGSINVSDVNPLGSGLTLTGQLGGGPASYSASIDNSGDFAGQSAGAGPVADIGVAGGLSGSRVTCQIGG